jgi:hypothetical protein
MNRDAGYGMQRDMWIDRVKVSAASSDPVLSDVVVCKIIWE